MLKKLLFITAFFSFQFSRAADGPLLNWGMSLPGPNSSTVNATVTDASGDVYITGSYVGTNVDFDFSSGTATLTSNGQSDVFIAKYSATGQLLWLKSIGGSGYDYAKSICILNGNIWLLGSFVGTIDFDPDAGVVNGTSLGAQSMFVLKLDGASGGYMWNAAFGGFGNAITPDNSGRILVVGKFSGAFDFDPGAGTTTLTSAGGDDISFICLTASGTLVTAKNLGGAGNDEASSVKVGAGANAPIAICGSFTGPVDFDWGAGVTTKTSTSADAFVMNVNEQFQLQWVNVFGGSGPYDQALSVDLDASNNTVLAGHIRGTADMDPTVSIAEISSIDIGTSNSFVAKYSLAGGYEWAFSLPALLPYNTELFAIATDAGNNVYVTGYNNNFDADPSPAQYLIHSTNPRSLVLLKYNGSGQLVWGTSLEQSNGSSSSGDGNSIDIDVNGNIFLGGTFYNDIDLDPSPNSTVVIHSNYTSGGMLVKYSTCNYPSSPVTVNDTVCQGSSLVYTATGTGTIGWYRYETGNNYLGTNTITVSNTNPGNYTYWVQDSTCGAGQRSPRTVTVVPQPDVALTAEFGVCDGLPAHLNATGADSYVWDIPATGASAVDTPSAPNEIYYVIGTNSFGCADTTSAAVNVWPAPVPMVFATDTIVCLGQSTLLSNLNLDEDDENVWSTGEATDSIIVTPVQNTDYYLAMQNGSGCYGYDTISIIVSSVDVSVSLNDSVLTVAEAGAAFYQWGDCSTNTPINGANSASYTATASGSYAVYVMNTAGCADTSECQLVDFTNTGIEGPFEHGISISPNPFSHQINIRLHDFGNDAIIKLYNAVGELIIHEATYTTNYTLHAPELSSGIYLLQVSNGVKAYHQKVVKE